MVNFMCQLGWTILPIFVAKHYFYLFISFAQVVSEGD